MQRFLFVSVLLCAALARADSVSQGPQIILQQSTPGAVQTGNANVSGTVNAGSYVGTGGVAVAALATPVNGTFSTACTGGTLADATSFFYRVTATNAAGETLGSTETSQATGACSGANTSVVTVTWAAVPSAVAYNVYGRTTGAETKITASIGTTGLSYIDTGSALSGALPSRNTSADMTTAGNITGTSGILTITPASNQSLTLLGTKTAASTGTDVSVNSTNTRTAGQLFAVQNNNANKLLVDFNGNLVPTGVTFANISAASTANGTNVWCTDCVAVNPCAASGSGAYANRINGVWVCNSNLGYELQFCFPSTGIVTGAPFGQSLFTNAATITATGTNVAPFGAVGVGAGNYVAKACSDGVTCGAGNIYVTYTAACTDALNSSDVVGGALTKSAVPANTTMTWNVTTACTSDSFNVCIHATVP